MRSAVLVAAVVGAGAVALGGGPAAARADGNGSGSGLHGPGAAGVSAARAGAAGARGVDATGGSASTAITPRAGTGGAPPAEAAGADADGTGGAGGAGGAGRKGGTGGVGDAKKGSAPAPDRLAVTVDDGAGGTTTYQLDCHPAGGTHPDPAGACARLDTLGGPLGPTPTDRMCSMVYGGPQTATVAGRWHGTEVVAHYRRTNGCESDRWRSMGPVLPSEEAPTG
jgi:hypothetical protein